MASCTWRRRGPEGRQIVEAQITGADVYDLRARRVDAR